MSIKDRLAGAMTYRAKGTRCSHCEQLALPSRGYCSTCYMTTVRLSEAIKRGRITKMQRHALWKECRGSNAKTRDLLTFLREDK